jgi:hypothetical protein
MTHYKTIGWAALLVSAICIVTDAAAVPESNLSLSTALHPPPVVLAQAAIPAVSPSDYILEICEKKQSGVRESSPIARLVDYLIDKNYLDQANPIDFPSIKIILLKNTEHGKMTAQADDYETYYVYTPTPTNHEDYEGKDKAVFMVEFEGKRYKIVLELHIFAFAHMKNLLDFTCPEPKLIKVNAKTVSGSSDHNLGNISAIFADLSSRTFGYAQASINTHD